MRETFVTSAFRHLEKERKKFPEEKTNIIYSVG